MGDNLWHFLEVTGLGNIGGTPMPHFWYPRGASRVWASGVKEGPVGSGGTPLLLIGGSRWFHDFIAVKGLEGVSLGAWELPGLVTAEHGSASTQDPRWPPTSRTRHRLFSRVHGKSLAPRQRLQGAALQFLRTGLRVPVDPWHPRFCEEYGMRPPGTDFGWGCWRGWSGY